jgi:hypothetical protein
MQSYVAARLRFGEQNSAHSPAGPLHAYANGDVTTFCGLSLYAEALMFVQMRWADRPRHEPVCRTCSAQAIVTG